MFNEVVGDQPVIGRSVVRRMACPRDHRPLYVETGNRMTSSALWRVTKSTRPEFDDDKPQNIFSGATANTYNDGLTLLIRWWRSTAG